MRPFAIRRCRPGPNLGWGPTQHGTSAATPTKRTSENNCCWTPGALAAKEKRRRRAVAESSRSALRSHGLLAVRCYAANVPCHPAILISLAWLMGDAWHRYVSQKGAGRVWGSPANCQTATFGNTMLDQGPARPPASPRMHAMVLLVQTETMTGRRVHAWGPLCYGITAAHTSVVSLCI